jgi:hypothetical protein
MKKEFSFKPKIYFIDYYFSYQILKNTKNIFKKKIILHGNKLNVNIL